MLLDKCRKIRVRKSSFCNHQRKKIDSDQNHPWMPKLLDESLGRNWIFTFSPSLSHRLLVNYKGNNGNIIVNRQMMH